MPYRVSDAAVLSVIVLVATPLMLSMPVAPTRTSLSAASLNTQSELRVGEHDLRRLELTRHHRRLDTLALDDREHAPRGEIGDDLEHGGRRHRDQPGLPRQHLPWPPVHDRGFCRLVEQDRRELRVRQSRIHPGDATGGRDLVRRQRIERMGSCERRYNNDAERERKARQMVSGCYNTADRE